MAVPPVRPGTLPSLTEASAQGRSPSEMPLRHRRYRALVPGADDLASLPDNVAGAAHVDDNGEVWWPSDEAERAVHALANAGHVILGLDLREYDAEGRFYEIAWSTFQPTGDDDVERSRAAALAAL